MSHWVLLFLCAASVCSSPLEKVVPAPFEFGPRIVGGQRASQGQFPWQAAIEVTKLYGETWCGGTLISSKWVLTAGHCVQDATNFRIALGSNALIGQDSSRVVVETSRYFQHEGYNPRTLANDVAVISLPEAVFLNGNIQPIGLASSDLFAGTTVTASGWGLTSDSDDGPSPFLNYVSLVTISSSECSRVYGTLTTGVVCAQGRTTTVQSTCEGDSGGPLVTYSSGTPILVGVASFGHSDGCESGNPVAFAGTQYFRRWIFDKTGV